MAYDKWRFNVRVSNTEPVMRLNVETRGDKELMAAKTEELLAIIGGEEAQTCYNGASESPCVLRIKRTRDND